MLDLFGNETEAPRAPQAQPVAISLFDAAAEQQAYKTGRAKSQHRAEIVAGSGYRCLCDRPLLGKNKVCEAHG